MEIGLWIVGGNRGRNNCHYFLVLLQTTPESLEVINDRSCPMTAGSNAGTAANAEIRLDDYGFAPSVVAKLDGANAYTSMAVDTFFIIDFNHGGKMSNHLASSSSIESKPVYIISF
jgi:hypothetical protein